MPRRSRSKKSKPARGSAAWCRTASPLQRHRYCTKSAKARAKARDAAKRAEIDFIASKRPFYRRRFGSRSQKSRRSRKSRKSRRSRKSRKSRKSRR